MLQLQTTRWVAVGMWGNLGASETKDRLYRGILNFKIERGEAGTRKMDINNKINVD